jgi:hypothetical protein
MEVKLGMLKLTEEAIVKFSFVGYGVPCLVVCSYTITAIEE